MRIQQEGCASEIDSLPGCSQIAVFHSTFIPPEHRGKGIGTLAHKLRLEMANTLMYDYTMCTVNAQNIHQIKILENFGWKQLDGFQSRKTGNKVLIYGKLLNSQPAT